MSYYINSKKISFTPVTLSDAQYIYNLRLEMGDFLGDVNIPYESHYTYIQNILEKEEAYYWIIQNQEKTQLGTIRINHIDPIHSIFSWGDWVLEKNTPSIYAVISSIMIYEFAFCHLQLQMATFNVRKKNLRTNSFHIKTGAEYTRETEKDIYMQYPISKFPAYKARYQKYIGDIIITKTV